MNIIVKFYTILLLSTLARLSVMKSPVSENQIQGRKLIDMCPTILKDKNGRFSSSQLNITSIGDQSVLEIECQDSNTAIFTTIINNTLIKYKLITDIIHSTKSNRGLAMLCFDITMDFGIQTKSVFRCSESEASEDELEKIDTLQNESVKTGRILENKMQKSEVIKNQKRNSKPKNAFLSNKFNNKNNDNKRKLKIRKTIGKFYRSKHSKFQLRTKNIKSERKQRKLKQIEGNEIDASKRIAHKLFSRLIGFRKFKNEKIRDYFINKSAKITQRKLAKLIASNEKLGKTKNLHALSNKINTQKAIDKNEIFENQFKGENDNKKKNTEIVNIQKNLISSRLLGKDDLQNIMANQRGLENINDSEEKSNDPLVKAENAKTALIEFLDEIRNELTNLIAYTQKKLQTKVTINTLKTTLIKILKKSISSDLNIQCNYAQFESQDPENALAKLETNDCSIDSLDNELQMNIFDNKFSFEVQMKLKLKNENSIRLKLESSNESFELLLKRSNLELTSGDIINENFEAQFGVKYTPDLIKFFAKAGLEIFAGGLLGSKKSTSGIAANSETTFGEFVKILNTHMLTTLKTKNVFPLFETAGKFTPTSGFKDGSLLLDLDELKKREKVTLDKGVENDFEIRKNTGEELSPYDYLAVFDTKKKPADEIHFGRFFGRFKCESVCIPSTILSKAYDSNPNSLANIFASKSKITQKVIDPELAKILTSQKSKNSLDGLYSNRFSYAYYLESIYRIMFVTIYDLNETFLGFWLIPLFEFEYTVTSILFPFSKPLTNTDLKFFN